MRIRIYIKSKKGSEEGHLDYHPPYKHFSGTVHIGCGGAMDVNTSELIEAGEIISLLDKHYEKKLDP